jgi:hypothetical protein
VRRRISQPVQDHQPLVVAQGLHDIDVEHLVTMASS